MLVLATDLVSGNTVSQDDRSTTVREGETVQLTCKYTTSFTNYALAWYKHAQEKPPLYLTQRHQNDYEHRATNLDRRFSTQLKTRDKVITLTIASTKLDDSATYYCALFDPQCCMRVLI
ncbi:M1-specific T cell receptor alpha chain-like [Acipenser oxyrinchus oxyrinchus]|nr:M1-specific T cell receptor alpha chain-like [Acipenser oxyrinchus oxyrinchus]